jgi:hypothetical protein
MYEQGNNKLKLDNITSIGLWVGLALIALGWLLLLRVMTIQGKLISLWLIRQGIKLPLPFVCVSPTYSNGVRCRYLLRLSKNPKRVFL